MPLENVDFDRALVLLSVIEKALGHGTRLQSLVVAATAELDAIANPPQEEPTVDAVPEADGTEPDTLAAQAIKTRRL